MIKKIIEWFKNLFTFSDEEKLFIDDKPEYVEKSIENKVVSHKKQESYTYKSRKYYLNKYYRKNGQYYDVDGDDLITDIALLSILENVFDGVDNQTDNNMEYNTNDEISTKEEIDTNVDEYIKENKTVNTNSSFSYSSDNTDYNSSYDSSSSYDSGSYDSGSSSYD